MMSLYGHDFAEVYSKYGYNEFAARVADLLPRVLTKLRAKPKMLLDLPCGEGTFAIKMAKKGYQVTGVDRSPGMLGIARRKARDAHVDVLFLERDMRAVRFREEFDLVTSWYDSLNYLLHLNDLKSTFAGARKALRSGGLFLFDMNTLRTLSKGWLRHPSFVEVDARGAFVVHRSKWHPREQISDLKVTAFVSRGQHWHRFDELHRERAYTLPQIRKCLNSVGFTELGCWGSIRNLTPPRRGGRKYWFAARR